MSTCDPTCLQFLELGLQDFRILAGPENAIFRVENKEFAEAKIEKRKGN